jgi:hypothetical protein
MKRSQDHLTSDDDPTKIRRLVDDNPEEPQFVMTAPGAGSAVENVGVNLSGALGGGLGIGGIAAGLAPVPVMASPIPAGMSGLSPTGAFRSAPNVPLPGTLTPSLGPMSVSNVLLNYPLSTPPYVAALLRACCFLV